MRHASEDDILADVRARLSLIEGHAAIAEPGSSELAHDDTGIPSVAKASTRRSPATIQTASNQQAPTAMRSYDAELDHLYASVAAVYTHAGPRSANATRDGTGPQAAAPPALAASAVPLHESRHRPVASRRDESWDDWPDDVMSDAEPIRVDPLPHTAAPKASAPQVAILADDPALATITDRLGALEDKLEAILARSTETAPTDAILDRMDELKSQYQRVADEIARLEVIEDNLARLIDEVAERNTDNTLLAESVAERVMSQIGSQNLGGQPSNAGVERLDGIEQMLSSYVMDRQTEDGQTQDLLLSIRALVETLDNRVGVIEHEIQQATAEAPETIPAADHARHHGGPAASAAEDTSYEIGPEAYASFEEAGIEEAPEAPAEPMPRLARRGAQAPEAEAVEAEPQPQLSTREQLIASARRAAKAAAAPTGAKPKVANAGKKPVKAAKADAGPQVSNRAARFALDKKSPRPVLILAILALVLAGGGLLYGKLTRKPSGPTIKIERSTTPEASKSEAAPAKTDKQSMIEQPLADPTDIETGSAAPDAADTFGTEPLETSAVSLDAPAESETPDVVGAVDEDMPAEGLAPLAIRIKAANGDPIAQYQIASQLARGALGTPDMSKAAEWYAKAAKTGYAPAQYQLASMLQRGSGVEKNPAEARAWYGKATAAGNIKAMHNLAVLLTSEDGGPRDYATAGKLFGKAAAHGLPDSQFNLAILYENGLGVKRSTTEAYRWFSLAAAAGDKEAATRREIMRKRLSPSIADRVNAEVKAWIPAKMDPAVNAVPALQADAAPADEAPAAAASDAPKPADVSLVQDLLKSLGYQVGSPGLLDARTSEAIESFEARSKLPKTGQISEDLIQRLMSLAG